MLDLVVRSDRVVTPHGVGAYDVAIQGERIVGVAAPGTLTGDVVRTIDATGKFVVPGGIDPHTHCHWPVPFPARPGEPGGPLRWDHHPDRLRSLGARRDPPADHRPPRPGLARAVLHRLRL